MTDTSLSFTNAQSGPEQMNALLSYFRLNGADVQALIDNGVTQSLDFNQMYQQLIQTQTYKTRFAGLIQRQQKGLPPISEAEAVANERQYAQYMQSAGLPIGFYDQTSDFQNLIANDVPPTELKSRIVDGYQAVENADPAVKAALQAQHGVTEGDLAAYFLDPQKTTDLLMRQVTSAKIAGTATRTGFGSLTTPQADNLTAIGINDQQAQTGFNHLASEQQLMNTLPGEGGNNISTDTQLSAEFGQNANAQTQITDAAARRKAAFAGGGGFANNKEGAAGIGTAR